LRRQQFSYIRAEPAVCFFVDAQVCFRVEPVVLLSADSSLVTESKTRMTASRALSSPWLDQNLLEIQVVGWACRSTVLTAYGQRPESEQAFNLSNFGQIAARFIMSEQSLY
jgi:hypothetical protein